MQEDSSAQVRKMLADSGYSEIAIEYFIEIEHGDTSGLRPRQ